MGGLALSRLFFVRWLAAAPRLAILGCKGDTQGEANETARLSSRGDALRAVAARVPAPDRLLPPPLLRRRALHRGRALPLRGSVLLGRRSTRLSRDRGSRWRRRPGHHRL